MFNLVVVLFVLLIAGVGVVHALKNGHLVFQSLPEGYTVDKTLDSIDGSIIALAYTSQTESYFTGENKHPCPLLNDDVYGTEYDAPGINKGHVMRFEYDSSKGAIVCKWMKVWPVYTTLSKYFTFGTRSQPSSMSAAAAGASDMIFLGGNVNEFLPVHAATFDFKCADPSQSVIGKGESFLMRLDATTGQCDWVKPVPNWINSESVHMATIGKHERDDDVTVYFTNTCYKSCTGLDYGDLSYTPRGYNSNAPEGVVVAMDAQGTFIWLRPLYTDASAFISTWPTALVVKRDPQATEDTVVVTAQAYTRVDTVQYPTDANGGTVTINEMQTNSFLSRFLILALNGNTGYVKAGTHFGPDSPNSSGKFVKFDHGGYIQVAMVNHSPNSLFKIRAATRGTCQEFLNKGFGDIVMLRLHPVSLQCQWSKSIATSQQDILSGMTYNSKGDNADTMVLFADVGADHDYNGDGTVTTTGNARIRAKLKSDGAISSVMDMSDATGNNYVYSSAKESNTMIAFGAQKHPKRIFFVFEKCPPGTFQDPSDPDACTECAEGTFSNTPGATSCKVCEGTANSAKSSCAVFCSAGKFGNPVSMLCESCPAAQYQDQPGQTSCKSCSAGRVVNAQRTTCDPCAAGMYSTGSACAMCPAGSFQQDPGQEECIPCSAIGSNAYQPEHGQDICNFCPSGSGVNVDRTGCTKCAPNTFSANGGACQPCPAGKKQDLEGQKSCVDDDGITAGGGGESGLGIGLGVGLGVGIPLLLLVAGGAAAATLAGAAAVTGGVITATRGAKAVNGNGDIALPTVEIPPPEDQSTMANEQIASEEAMVINLENDVSFRSNNNAII